MSTLKGSVRPLLGGRSPARLMAGLAVHDKAAPDRSFSGLFPLIERGAFDPRNFVKKAVNWALRNVGKRNPALNAAAVACAEAIRRAADERAHQADRPHRRGRPTCKLRTAAAPSTIQS
jgi:hypothetical protein